MQISSDELHNIVNSNNVRSIQSNGGVGNIGKRFHVNLSEGIDPSSIPQRISLYGNNEFFDRDFKPFFTIAIRYFFSIKTILLISLVVYCLITDYRLASYSDKEYSVFDEIFMLISIIAIIFIQSYIDYRDHHRLILAKKQREVFDVNVIRKGVLTKIKNYDVVVGDIIQLQPGSTVPSDGVLIDYDQIFVDQLSINGEYISIPKDEHDPFLISGSTVTSGSGQMLTLCVGHQPRYDISSHSNSLQKRVDSFGNRLGKKVGVISFNILLVLIVIWIINIRYSKLPWGYVREPINFFVIFLSFITCSSQKWPHFVYSLSLDYMERKLSNEDFSKYCLYESYGPINIICTNKTGILTKNQMNVEQCIINNRIFRCKDITNFSTEIKPLLANTFSLSCNLNEEYLTQTDYSLLNLVNTFGFDSEQIRKNAKVVKCFQFDKSRNLFSTITQQNEGYNIYVKGTPEDIIKLCTHYYNENGKVETITKDFIEKLTQINNSKCEQGFTTMCIAQKYIKSLPNELTNDIIESDLTLVTIICVYDPIRDNSRKAIIECQSAGTKVIMITGDSLITSKTIAKKCHILTKNKIAITAKEFFGLNYQQQMEILNKIAVVTNASTNDKKNFINLLLKEYNENIGITENISLTFPNVNNIHRIVNMGNDINFISNYFKWNCCLLYKIRCFIQFQLMIVTSTLLTSIVTSFFISEMIFNGFQTLYTNFVIVILGAIIYSIGKPKNYMLQKKKLNNNTSLLTPFMVKNITFQVLYLFVVILLIIIFPPMNAFPFGDYHYSFILNVFVFAQIFNMFNAMAVERNNPTTKNFNESPSIIMIICGIVLFQILLLLCGTYVGCHRLGFKDWMLSVVIASVALPLGKICRNGKSPEMLRDKSIYNFLHSILE